ncbi:hypothetical protein ABK046_51215, partial [Streptomyces caeruleatus]
MNPVPEMIKATITGRSQRTYACASDMTGTKILLTPKVAKAINGIAIEKETREAQIRAWLPPETAFTPLSD